MTAFDRLRSRGRPRRRRDRRDRRSRAAPTTSTTSSRSRRERDSGRAGPSSKGGSPWTPPSRGRAAGRLAGPRPIASSRPRSCSAHSLAAAPSSRSAHATRAAPPYGPADERRRSSYGGDDIYVRDSLDGAELDCSSADRATRPAPGFSLDGQLVAYDNVVDGVDRLWVANADGSGRAPGVRPGGRRLVARLVRRQPPPVGRWWRPGNQQALACTSSRRRRFAGAQGGPRRPGPEPDGRLGPAGAGAVAGRALCRRDGIARPVLRARRTGTGLRDLPMPWPAAFGKDWDLSGHAFSDDGNRDRRST